MRFRSKDNSVTNSEENVGGAIKSITEFSNGAYVGMSFETYKQDRTPRLKEALRITHAGNIGINDIGPANFTGYTNLSIHGSTGGAITFGDDGVDEWEIYGGDGTLKIYDRANTQERIRIVDNGAIGLGGANYGTAGQVLTSGGGSAAPSWAGGGKVLQVVGSISQNATVISGTSPATTNLSQTITPSKTGSKMLVLFSGHYSQNHNGGSYGPQTKIYMYKKIGSGADNQVFLAAYDYVANTNAVYHSHHYSASWYDQTGSTAGTDQKYTIYANLLYANHQMRFNPGGGYSQWTILEIG